MRYRFTTLQSHSRSNGRLQPIERDKPQPVRTLLWPRYRSHWHGAVPVNETRCEFLLAFFDLVDTWSRLDSHDLAQIAPAGWLPTTHPVFSQFCAHLHLCFLAWGNGLDTRNSADHPGDFHLVGKNVFRSDATERVFSNARSFAQAVLRSQAMQLAECYLQWLRNYCNGFSDHEKGQLLQRYYDAFRNMHLFVSTLLPLLRSCKTVSCLPIC